MLTTADEQARRLIQELLTPVTQDSDKEYNIVFSQQTES